MGDGYAEDAEERTVTNEDSTVHLDLYVRSLAPAGPHRRQEAVLDRLAHLGSCRGVSADVEVWGRRLRLDGIAASTRPGREIRRTVEAFERWACDRDAALSPFFERRQVDPFVGEPYRVLTLPRLCLAVHTEGDLRWVFPHRRAGQTYDVWEFLEEFEPPHDRSDVDDRGDSDEQDEAVVSPTSSPTRSEWSE